jgi:SNF family Na+-dependent transporter
MTIQAYAVYYLFYSFRATVPWSKCSNDWNTNSCVEFKTNMSWNQTAYVSSLSSTNEFFNRKILGVNHSDGFESLSGLKWDLVFCLFIVVFVTSLCLVYGIKSSGKAVYVTAILPYICLIVLVVQGFSLDGAYDGLYYYLKPDFSKLKEFKVWLAAAVQIFFSLGPGFGVLIALSSYSTKERNVQTLTIMCSIVNCLTSFLYGLVVFSGIGYMAKKLNTSITSFIQEGPGLVYIVYPEIIATFKGAPWFAVIFFLMLLTLGIDSSFGGMEGLYTAISDEHPFFKTHSYLSRFIISLVPFLAALPTVTHGGIYVVQWLDTFSVSPCVIFIVFMELITVCWLYGYRKFSDNICSMNKRKPFLSWIISWTLICPAALFVILIFSALNFETIQFGGYKYPLWSSVLGWLLNFAALLPIPGYAGYICLQKARR